MSPLTPIGFVFRHPLVFADRVLRHFLALLSLEAASIIIILLGAQVIAEYELLSPEFGGDCSA